MLYVETAVTEMLAKGLSLCQYIVYVQYIFYVFFV